MFAAYGRLTRELSRLVKENIMHRPNQDPVQIHSAGSLYPCVIYRHDIDGVPTWGVYGPHGTHLRGFPSHEAAEVAAHQLKYYLNAA